MDLSAVLPASVANFSRRNNMITIFCAIPELGSVFPVDIDSTQTVGHLKNKIKEAKPYTIRFDADMLKLYLARDDGAWLNSNDRDVKALERREVSERVGNLMQEHSLLVQGKKLNHDALFGKRFKTAAHDIHVLVEMPEDCEFPGRSNMVTIFCAIPETGSVFPVDIDIRQTVGHLKAKIKEAAPDLIRFDADMLKLYLARDDGAWLNSNDRDVKALERREASERVGNLMQEHSLLVQSEKLNHDALFGKRFKTAAHDIHVLVEMPEDCEFPGRSNMVTIFCAIPETGSVFPVDIDIRQTVGHLKNKIKEAAPDLIRFDAGMLKLYLARDDGAWLNSNDRDVKALERREASERVGNLMQEHSLLVQGKKLNHDALFGKRFKTAAHDIHVLVEMPEDCEFPGRSNMVTIFCAIPETGSVFPVDIDIRQTVGHLKAKIKEAKPNTIRFDADMLKLFLAKDRGGWMNRDDNDGKALMKREVRDRVRDLMQEPLDGGLKLNHDVCLGKRFAPADRDIHVLVEQPEDPIDVRHYKNCRKWVRAARILAFTATIIIFVVALSYRISPTGTDEKACIASGVPVYVCVLVAIVIWLPYARVHLLLDAKEKEYESEIVKAYMTMGFPYEPIP